VDDKPNFIKKKKRKGEEKCTKNKGLPKEQQKLLLSLNM